MPDSFYEMACIFFLYGFLGWCVEVVYAAVNHGEFVNRGFLYGPICPIYGVGMLAVISALTPIKDNFALLYLGSVAITTAIELLMGVVAMRLFHTRLWDYSDQPYNLKGYICVKFSLVWGIGALVIVDILHPILMAPIALVPVWLGTVILSAFGTILVVDFTLTVIEALKLPRRIRALQEIEKMLSTVSDGIGENLADNTFRARAHKEELKVKLEKYRQLFDTHNRELSGKHFFHAFPHLRTRYAVRFEKLKMMYQTMREEKSGDEDAKDQ